MATVAVTPDQNAVVGEIFIAAPPERVFQAITDPKQMPQWWGQQGVYRITEWKADVRPGGKWSSVGLGADGTSFGVEGEYLEVNPPRLLVHTWIATFSGPLKTVMRWELEAQNVHNLHNRGPEKAGTGTLLKIRHEGFAGVPQAAASHAEGWKRILGWLHSFVEENETVETRKPVAKA